MTISEALLPEYDLEMTTTRKVIERVPSDKGDWKPHPKSFSLASLAQLIAGMPGWLTNAVRETELDLAKGGGYTRETTSTLLAVFDKNVKESRAAIASATDADFAVEWSLKMGGKVLFTSPRRVVVRQHINHLVHHRGQMTVYLRLLDVPVPSIYGPTADEKMF
jgi:uncharacterized damage-inducible protein DinB